MSRLTVRFAEASHQRLNLQAEREGVSLNHYIVYTLTRTVTAAELESQRQTFEQLTSRYRAEEAEAALREILAARH